MPIKAEPSTWVYIQLPVLKECLKQIEKLQKQKNIQLNFGVGIKSH
jgi:hypothetical protein